MADLGRRFFGFVEGGSTGVELQIEDAASFMSLRREKLSSVLAIFVDIAHGDLPRSSSRGHVKQSSFRLFELFLRLFERVVLGGEVLAPGKKFLQGSFVRDVAEALLPGGVRWHGKLESIRVPSSWRGMCFSVNSTRQECKI